MSEPISGADAKSIDGLKKRIMWATRTDAANLAHYLGFGWCCGVNGLYIGDDMKMEGDSWVSNLTPTDGKTPTEYKWQERLKITYGDWRFKLIDVTFDKPVIDTEMKPVAMFEGKIENDDNQVVTEKATAVESVARKVTNSTTDGFKFSQEAGLKLTYTAGIVSGSVDFNFNESNSTKSTDATGTVQKETFTLNQSKELQPYTAAKWTMMISSMKTTVPYTAKVVAEFSLTLSGFLRWGGEDGSMTNFHMDYYRSDKRPSISYTFGSKTEPFTEALKEQSSLGKVPWRWAECKKRFPAVQNEIDDLLEPNQYQTSITGVIEDIRAMHSSVRWTEIPLKIEN